MADFIQGLFGGKATTTSVVSDDFADYATAASPSPASYTTPLFTGATPTPGARPYTKWYRVWERTQVSDFYTEMFLVPVVLLILFQVLWGRRTNRTKAKNWVAAHAPILQKEYASVGFDNRGATATGSQSEDLGPLNPGLILREKTATEFITYATGRQNVAFTDVKINLLRRFNPMVLLAEYISSIVIASLKPPKESVEITTYAFDGREKDIVPAPTSAEEKPKVAASGYDGFVWAIVHKDQMKELRQERFDVSLTDVKDNAKLPNWATVMSESAEITDALLTPELVKAVETAGDDLFETLLITDQPADKPKNLDELEPRKRLLLQMKLPSGTAVSTFDRMLPLVSHFIRLPDELVSKGRFRAEVSKRLRNTREAEAKRVRKTIDDEKADERKEAADRRKKEEREKMLRNMTPAEQRKYLDKEREKSNRKGMRKMKA